MRCFFDGPLFLPLNKSPPKIQKKTILFALFKLFKDFLKVNFVSKNNTLGIAHRSLEQTFPNLHKIS